MVRLLLRPLVESLFFDEACVAPSLQSLALEFPEDVCGLVEGLALPRGLGLFDDVPRLCGGHARAVGDLAL